VRSEECGVAALARLPCSLPVLAPFFTPHFALYISLLHSDPNIRPLVAARACPLTPAPPIPNMVGDKRPEGGITRRLGAREARTPENPTPAPRRPGFDFHRRAETHPDRRLTPPRRARGDGRRAGLGGRGGGVNARDEAGPPLRVRRAVQGRGVLLPVGRPHARRRPGEGGGPRRPRPEASRRPVRPVGPVRDARRARAGLVAAGRPDGRTPARPAAVAGPFVAAPRGVGGVAIARRVRLPAR
jgi:hypothetical protein